jgi:hypothetical protein
MSFFWQVEDGRPLAARSALPAAQEGERYWLFDGIRLAAGSPVRHADAAGRWRVFNFAVSGVSSSRFH